MRALYRLLPIVTATLALACSSEKVDSGTPVEHGVWVNMGGPPLPDAPRVDEVPLHPAVRYEGRFDRRDAAGPKCAWPACRATASFEGNTARVTLREEAEPWMTGGPSEWDVLVDGEWKWKLVAQPGVHEYTLVTGIHWGVHQVELYRRTEARYGTTQILGFDFHVGVLQAAPRARPRRIEVIGDATSAGFGIEGVGRGEGCPGGANEATWQNIRLAYPQRLADLLGAELDATVATGAGVARNVWRPDPTTIAELQERMLPFDPSSAMVHETRPVDAVVVMVGESDFAIGLPDDDGVPSDDEFRAAYADLVDRVRARLPGAEIFLATSPTASDREPEGRRTRTTIGGAILAITDERRDRGDLWIHAIAPGPAIASELTACAGHGNEAFHERVAQELAERIRERSMTKKWSDR